MTRRRFGLAAQLIVALTSGTIVGLLAGPKAAILGEVGVIVITLLKTMAPPLVFFAIVEAFCKTEIKPRQGVRLLGLSLMNALVATVIALSLCHLFPAQKYVSLVEIGRAISVNAAFDTPPAAKLTPGDLIHAIVPTHVLEPFVTNNVLAVVFLALLVGSALRAVKSPATDGVEKLVSAGLLIVSKILEWIVRLVPIAAFCIIAKVVGTTGFAVFGALSFFVILVAGGMLIHVGLYYSILLWAVAKKSPAQFFKQAFEALMTSLSTGSSLATLPVTLRTLQNKMKVSASSASLAACVGTNFNHVGILLYEAVAALFVSQIQGVTLSTSQQLSVAATSALAAVGIAGIPDAGLITLSLVLSAVGLPLTAVPLLLPVDWLIGRLRATTNVASDMTVAILLDKFET